VGKIFNKNDIVKVLKYILATVKYI
jgi:hypothetical protein